MDRAKIDKALEDWEEEAKKAQQASNFAAGNASTISYSSSSNSQSASHSKESDDIEVSPSAPPPQDDEVNLKEYLEKYIDGYLVGDLDTLVRKVRKEQFNCSFVIILTVCSGIEFLGTLLYPDTSKEYKRGWSNDSFKYYWENYLDDKYAKAIDGNDAYNLIRNGLAHCFMVKHGIGTIRLRQDEHLKPDTKDNLAVLKIDADSFFADFKSSYEQAKEVLLDGKKAEKLAKRRLNDQLRRFIDDSSNFLEHLSQNNTKTHSTGTTTALDIPTRQ